MEQNENNIEEIAKSFLVEKAVGNLKESSLSRYTYLCKKYIIPYFKDIHPTDLNNESIENFIQHLRNGCISGKPLAPKTINDILSLLLQIIKSGCQFEIDIKKLTLKQSEINIFTEAEYSKLKSYLLIATDNQKLGIMIAMLTGIRIGELCALKWEDIDLELGTVQIDKTIQRVKSMDVDAISKTKVIIDTPKSTASIRTIPLPLILLSKLSEFRAGHDTYVLTNKKKYIEPRVYQRRFKSYLEACNIKDNKFHTVRHTFATMAISRGMDIKTLSVLLGHTDVSFTMKTYVHPNLEHRRIQIEKLAVGF